MNKSLFARWRANFFTGLAIVLPGMISLILVIWLLKNIAAVTDVLLVFLPRAWTHTDGGAGPLHWYSSLLAFLTSVLIISGIGKLGRIYIGQKAIELGEGLLMQIPLVNKIYSTIKQVNEALTSGNKSSFKQVVLVEFPRPGMYSLGFITSDAVKPMAPNMPGDLVSVFIPTTPNPTSGFMVLLPTHAITKLDLSVADGIKYIISIGALPPDQQQAMLVEKSKPQT
jgi:uncharacterized membrane protein